VKTKLILPILLLFACSEKPDTLYPELSEITESVYASGNIKAMDQYTLFPSVSGTLIKFMAQPGDSIKIGDTICIIENDFAELEKRNSQLILKLAEINARDNGEKINEARQNLLAASEKYQLDSSLYTRQKRLWEQNIGSRFDLEQKELVMTQSKIARRTSQARLNQLKNQLENEKERAAVGLDIAELHYKNYAVTSRLNGRLFNTSGTEGDLVSPQTPLAVVGGTNSFFVELLIDEDDIAKVQLNQRIFISMDSYPNEVFQATISKIYPLMDERTLSFKIEAIFGDTPGQLYPNLTVEANILIHEKSKAIVIPREYLIDDQFVLLEDGAQRQVKVGLKDYQKVEILEGLDTLTAIILP